MIEKELEEEMRRRQLNIRLEGLEYGLEQVKLALADHAQEVGQLKEGASRNNRQITIIWCVVYFLITYLLAKELGDGVWAVAAAIAFAYWMFWS